jgi:hypothetical protein
MAMGEAGARLESAARSGDWTQVEVLLGDVRRQAGRLGERIAGLPATAAPGQRP